MEDAADHASGALQNPAPINVGTFPLQRLVRALPPPLRRIKIVKLIASITGTPYYRIAFQTGELIGNVQDYGRQLPRTGEVRRLWLF
jgi:hypothetical protein